MTMNLRDTLLAALALLPGTRDFHLHVLITVPRKNTSLFPFASPRPRVHVQDILLLLSEQRTPSAPHKLVTALEAHLYTLPSTRSAILHISKVDSTGQALAPSPTTALVRAFIAFYADPATRPVSVENMWVQLFARAQGQYLFPNSIEYEGKRPLSDAQLCVWWKRVLSEVEAGLRDKGTATGLYYVLPGYSEEEAVHVLKHASGTWMYGHPYAQSEIGLPCAPGKDNLGHVIPSFDDDPKARFMDEIAYTTDGDVKSPKRKRRRTEGEEEEDAPLGELRKVSTEEFWERMSFRQECGAGAVTGFFALGIRSASVDPALAPQRGQVSSQLLKRVLTTLTSHVEFSTEERTMRGTEMMEGAIRGLCEGDLSDIYGTVSVRNAMAATSRSETGTGVRVLTARKKRKVE